MLINSLIPPRTFFLLFILLPPNCVAYYWLTWKPMSFSFDLLCSSPSFPMTAYRWVTAGVWKQRREGGNHFYRNSSRLITPSQFTTSTADLSGLVSIYGLPGQHTKKKILFVWMSLLSQDRITRGLNTKMHEISVKFIFLKKVKKQYEYVLWCKKNFLN